MPRPGCVWTHTLLIDFTDLGALENLSGLLGMFRRPLGANAVAEYGRPTVLTAGAQPPLSLLAEHWARQVIIGLYGKPRSRIVVSRFGDEVDHTVLALWSQQWPRLRRSFRFCTLAASDRSTDICSFDLQVLPTSDRGFRTRFSDVIDAETITATGRWFDDAIQDLLHPKGSGLRGLFRRVGADIAASREAFRPLCRLHRALTAAHTHHEAVYEAIAILQEELPPHSSPTARAIVAKAALEQVETLDERSFDFLWNNLSALDWHTLMSGAVRLGRSAWRREPGLLVSFLNDEGAGGVVVDRTLAELDTADLVVGLSEVPALRDEALARRPELVGKPAFWAGLDSVDDAFRAAKKGYIDATASALVLAGRGDLASRAVREFGSMPILNALSAAWDATGTGVESWLHASAEDPTAVAEFLAAGSIIPRPMMHGLARILPPQAVPNDYGEDPWLIASRHGVGVIDDTAASFMAAYLFSRALTRRSRSAAELTHLTFESVHSALVSNRLPLEAWRLLESRLPRSAIFFESDRCRRLRASVVALFIDRDLPPALFARLCSSEKLFSLLSEEAARSRRGRRYLKRVRRRMDEELDPRLAVRLSIVKALLK